MHSSEVSLVATEIIVAAYRVEQCNKIIEHQRYSQL